MTPEINFIAIAVILFIFAMIIEGIDIFLTKKYKKQQENKKNWEEIYKIKENDEEF